MRDRIHPLPAFLAQPLELHDRAGACRIDRLREEMNHLLCDRSPLSPGTCPKMLVESVREVLEVERCHRILQSSSGMEALT
jgi:hypothetical protein